MENGQCTNGHFTVHTLKSTKRKQKKKENIIKNKKNNK